MNPLKAQNPGAEDTDRIAMLKLACQGLKSIKPCFIEFDMPRPSYTIDTLRRLAQDYPSSKFSLIIGSDNWQIFNQWKRPDEIIHDFGIIIYPRQSYDVNLPLPIGVVYVENAPKFTVSSTEVRSGLHKDLIPLKVLDYISAHNLYGKQKTIE